MIYILWKQKNKMFSNESHNARKTNNYRDGNSIDQSQQRTQEKILSLKKELKIEEQKLTQITEMQNWNLLILEKIPKIKEQKLMQIEEMQNWDLTTLKQELERQKNRLQFPKPYDYDIIYNINDLITKAEKKLMIEERKNQEIKTEEKRERQGNTTGEEPDLIKKERERQKNMTEEKWQQIKKRTKKTKRHKRRLATNQEKKEKDKKMKKIRK